jgi:hypothetical protein
MSTKSLEEHFTSPHPETKQEAVIRNLLHGCAKDEETVRSVDDEEGNSNIATFMGCLKQITVQRTVLSFFFL